VKPLSGNGKLLWHALGAKTVELINENVHLESVRDDVETLVLDAQVLEDILKEADPAKRGREIDIKLIARLKKHLGNPKFTALGERLEKIKERHEQGFLNSLEFLKRILELAKRSSKPKNRMMRSRSATGPKEALTELFNEAKNTNTHIIVERMVGDIDDIVKKVHFPDWQHTTQGERLVQKKLRRTLLKHKLHTDQDLFDRAYAYIKQYYGCDFGETPLQRAPRLSGKFGQGIRDVPKLFTYARYNAELSREGLNALASELDRCGCAGPLAGELRKIQPAHVQQMDSVEHIDKMQRVGEAVGKTRVKADHLPTSPCNNQPRPTFMSDGVTEGQNGTCFVVMGFGKKTDFETGNSFDLDKSYKNMIKPAVIAAGLKCIRVDEIVHSGLIDVPMYDQLLKADVVLADLSTSNKNAFYELGVRHALRPFTTVVISEDGMKAPFDVNHVVVRKYHHLGSDIGFDEVVRFRAELTDAIRQVLAKDPRDSDSPVYAFIKDLRPPAIELRFRPWRPEGVPPAHATRIRPAQRTREWRPRTAF